MVRNRSWQFEVYDGDRKGITLFEVVLALAIFLGASAAITQILQNGGTASIRAQVISEAVVRSQRKMNEVTSGVQPAQSVQQSVFEDDPRWQWTLNVVETGVPYLLEIQVVVEHTNSEGQVDGTYQLNRLLRDQVVFEEAALAASGEEL